MRRGLCNSIYEKEREVLIIKKSTTSQQQLQKNKCDSSCMNRSITPGKKEVKIAFFSTQEHSHIEEESVTSGVTLQDLKN